MLVSMMTTTTTATTTTVVSGATVQGMPSFVPGQAMAVPVQATPVQAASTRPSLASSFRMFDADGSGSLSAEEMRALLSSQSGGAPLTPEDIELLIQEFVRPHRPNPTAIPARTSPPPADAPEVNGTPLVTGYQRGWLPGH